MRTVPLPAEPAAGRCVESQEQMAGDRFLVANSNSGRVMEVDASGKVVWETNVPGPCGVERASGGHTLVGGFNGQVVELDAAGKQVWEKTGEGYAQRPVHRP